jgi:hypothetical protein
MKLPLRKDQNFVSVGANGQAEVDWRPSKSWLKPRQYWAGIVTYFQCRITQGAIEAINGIIQLG